MIREKTDFLQKNSILVGAFSFISIVKLSILFFTLFSLTGCYSRNKVATSAERVSTAPSVESRKQDNIPPGPPSGTTNGQQSSKQYSQQFESQVVPRSYSSPLPGTVITDLTIPGGITKKYDNEVYSKTVGNQPSLQSQENHSSGFNDAAGASALNLNQELSNRSRPSVLSNVVHDPAIPSAIPSDEVSTNNDFSRPSSFNEYNAGYVSDSNSLGNSRTEALSPEDYIQPQRNNEISESNGISTKSSVRTYTVIKGDTLYSISRKYSVTVGQILSANDSLDNPDQLYRGQELEIP